MAGNARCTSQPSAIERARSVLYRSIHLRVSARRSISLSACLYLGGWTAALLRQVVRAAVRVVLHLLASCADRDGAVRLAVRCRQPFNTQVPTRTQRQPCNICPLEPATAAQRTMRSATRRARGAQPADGTHRTGGGAARERTARRGVQCRAPPRRAARRCASSVAPRAAAAQMQTATHRCRASHAPTHKTTHAHKRPTSTNTRALAHAHTRTHARPG
jgi:hypothetical protein